MMIWRWAVVLPYDRDSLGNVSCSRFDMAATLRDVHLHDCVYVTMRLTSRCVDGGGKPRPLANFFADGAKAFFALFAGFFPAMLLKAWLKLLT